MNTDKPVRFSQRALSWFIIGLLVWQPVAPSFAAAITPAGPATMDKAANGVPVVNIAAPNGAGISHNRFNEYNVGPEGLILNNATGQLNQTQLGGLIQNNPNLRAGQEARGIINEVTGGSRSQLQGYTEVAGKAANVMVANPYGITCNGCGFINTPNATLTTGKPQFDAAGNLAALEVTKGTITVEGKGLDASGSDALSLIARATEVNAAIHAKDLTVTTGANRVDAAGKATAGAGEGAAPVVAVDTGALGGMYANRIHLVSTEKGVGVNLGNLTARQGDITLDANGRMTVKNSLAGGSLTAKGDGVTLSGSHKAGGDIAVNSTQDVALNGATLAADGKLTLSGSGNTTLTGSSLTSGGEMAVSGKQIATDAASQANAAGNVTLTAQNMTQQGKLISGGETRLTADRLDNRGTVATKGQLTATASNLNNSGTLQGQTLTATGDEVQNTGTLASDGTLSVHAGALTTGADSTVTGKGDVTLVAQATADLNGRINADKALNVKGRDVQTRQTAQVQSGGSMTLAAGNSATLNGTQAAKGALDISAKTLSHSGKSNAAAITLTAPDGITNSGTLVTDTLNLSGSHITNSGLLQGTQMLNLQTSGLDNLAGGTLYSAQNLTLALPELTNNGLITTDGDLRLSGNTLVNGGEINGVNLIGDYRSLTSSGKLLADNGLSLTAEAFGNSGLLASRNTAITAGMLNNRGTVQGDDTLTLAAQTTANSGTMRSAGALTFTGQTLDNSGNISATSLLLTLAQQAHNRATGRLVADNALTLNAPQLLNSGLIAATKLELNNPDIVNSGTLQGTDSLVATGTALTNQQGGLLLSAGSLVLKNDSLTNAGQLQGDTLDLATGEWVNTGNALGENGLNASVSGNLTNQGRLLSRQALTLRVAGSQNSGSLMAKVLALHGDLRNSGLLQGTENLTWDGDSLTSSGQMVSGDSLALRGTAVSNQGSVLSQHLADITATEVLNDGTLAAKDLRISAPRLTSNGILQGNDSLILNTQALVNGSTGQLVSGGDLNLDLTSLDNQGLLSVNDGLTLKADTLSNRGQIAAGSVSVTGHTVTNSGLIQGTQQAQATADTLINAETGKWLSGGELAFSAATLTNNGLWQGTQGLTLNAGTLTTASGSRTLSGGDFTLHAGQLSTQGTLQGGKVSVTADDWMLGGSLLSLGDFTATVGGTLTLPGSLSSRGTADIQAQTLRNSGQLLSEGDVTLSGQTLENNGAVQGKTLTAHEAGITNNGTLTGLDNLTLDAAQPAARLMARMAMAAPQLTLINGETGSLLTQGTLGITAGTVDNGGLWQGNAILLAAQSLDNRGAIRSAGDLNLQLTGNLNSATGSKITALGTAALQALSLSNQGQWAAKNLTLRADALTNSGAVSGSDGLTVALTGNATQLAGGSLASNGALTLNADTLGNAGNIQGNGLTVTANSLTNSAGGELVSTQGLTLTTPSLFNYGLIQGAGDIRVDSTTLARNEGRLLSGGQLTLTTPQYTGAGWLQATNLILNAARNGGTGTLLADQMTLTGDSFTNQGTTQANTLALSYRQLTNNGTLLGKNQLTVNATQVEQSTGGKLFSGGDLFVGAAGLNALGQVVALGNLTLQLTNAFTAKTTLAAGKTLSVTSNGAIDNQSVMQGQAVNLSAGGQLTSSGQITTGSGASTLSGSAIVLNGNSALQGGGDITLASRGNITVNGFAGTTGSLTLSAPGAIINTALLYAANNLALYANSITNQRGDMLAGNNLWLQRDAAGNASSEVINTSGNIETTNGDITIKTGHLLNQRESVRQGTTTKENFDLNFQSYIPGVYELPLSLFTPDEYLFVNQKPFFNCECGGKPDPNAINTTVIPSRLDLRKAIAVSRVTSTTQITGNAARISAGRNLTAQTGILDNLASFVLAGNNLSMSGNSLNNQSYLSGTQTVWRIYTVAPGYELMLPKGEKEIKGVLWWNTLSFTATDEYITDPGTSARGVIQSNGTTSLNFGSVQNNSDSTDVKGTIAPTLQIPGLKGLGAVNAVTGSNNVNLKDIDSAAIPSLSLDDKISEALKGINGANPLAFSSVDAPNGTQPGGGTPDVNMVADNITRESVEKSHNTAINPVSAKKMDISTYPLPTGDNGYFVYNASPKSPYLITVNPKLDGLGQLDPALFSELNALLNIKAGEIPRETNSKYTDEKQFLGSSYMLSRLNINPDYDYRFLGDAVFDTRYVSNVILSQTGNRYISGIGSDLEQMQYLMDNAAIAQSSLGLKFGVSLTAEQIASLGHSILWWESTTINGEVVMVPKVYLSAKDAAFNNGSIIAGNNIDVSAGAIDNNAGTMLARNDLKVKSSSAINNSGSSVLKAGNALSMIANDDINNIGSTISGKIVSLESIRGDVNNITVMQSFSAGKFSGGDLYENIYKDVAGNIASISAEKTIGISAGNDVNIKGANVTSSGDLLIQAGGDVSVASNVMKESAAFGLLGKTNVQDFVMNQASTVSAKEKLVVNSGRDTNVVASDIKGGVVAVNAAHNLNVGVIETGSKRHYSNGNQMEETAFSSSSLSSVNNLSLSAGNDINSQAASYSSGMNFSATAVNDLNLAAANVLQTNKMFGTGSHETALQANTITSGKNLILVAGQDINSHATGLVADERVGLQAGRDVNLLAETISKGNSNKSGKDTTINEQVRQQGTEVISGTNTLIIAGRDVSTEAAEINAKGDIGVLAGRDINLATATESDYSYREKTRTHKGFLSKSKTHTISEQSATRESGTLLSGDNVNLTSGHDLLVQGSAVVGDGKVALNAGNNVTIEAATDTDTNWQLSETKKSGLMSTGGIGFTIGSSQTRQELKEKGTTQSQSVSTVGSTHGDVSITAGNQLQVKGADLVAGQDLTLAGDSVSITPGHDQRTREDKFEQKSTGLTVALSGVVGDALNKAVSTVEAVQDQTDSRLQTLQVTKAALAGVQAVQGVRAAAAAGDPASAVGVSISLSTQKSSSQQLTVSDSVSGSTLSAGNNLSITANGKGDAKNSGDIVIAGSQLKATGDTTFNAERDILLSGAANTQKSTGKNSSSGGGVGVSIGAGNGGAGISVYANVNAGKGNNKGNGTNWTETTVDSGGTVNINSGRDTVLTGAQVNGDRVVADIGRDLTITSQQDSNYFDSKQTSFGAGGSFTFGTMTGSGSVSLSQDKMHSTFDSVAEQSGIYAGKNGFDITVGNHTQLNGAVISSQSEADKNRLDTGTLGFTDMHNEADYKVSHKGVSMGMSSGGSLTEQLAMGALSAASGALQGAAGSSGHAEGTTQSAISNGAIMIRDKANQQQDIGSLSRDVAAANDAISPIFDKEK
ncbi:hemagglutinin repeat-containing protein [Kosakonia oryzendophytica]|uniref:hemagglutinin repeat-containing protein n=1 Tax=Kosakonia oryzendophytica TaxID=1005665 RepID=UPI0022EC96DE|nr:hemagglutinin repeat-containing protein [Kosakonia oryzendophytica]WBT57059.1 hemagglutinin repeat-containing protein [Kosakonia oryzendophytica]